MHLLEWLLRMTESMLLGRERLRTNTTVDHGQGGLRIIASQRVEEWMRLVQLASATVAHRLQVSARNKSDRMIT